MSGPKTDEAGPETRTLLPALKSRGGNGSAQPIEGTTYRPISAAEPNAMPMRSEMLPFGQPLQGQDPQVGGSVNKAFESVPAPSDGPYTQTAPALNGMPIVPQASYPRPEKLRQASISRSECRCLVDGSTGTCATSTAMHPSAPATPNPEKAAESGARCDSTASDGVEGRNDVAHNVQKAQRKIKISVKASPLAAPTPGAQPPFPQTQSYFVPM